MMKNKVLIKAIFPSIDKSYDIKIPVNELVWKTNKLIVKAIYDMNGIEIDLKNDTFLMLNKVTGEVYKNNVAVIDKRLEKLVNSINANNYESVVKEIKEIKAYRKSISAVEGEKMYAPNEELYKRMSE